MRQIHVMLRVVDLDKMIKFYTGALGMQLLRKVDFPEGRFTLAFVGYGDEKNHAVIEFTCNWDTGSYTKGDAFGHIAILCDDLQATCERVRCSEGKLISEPHKMKGGPVMAFARDPEGYELELLGPDVFELLEKGFDK